MKLPVVQDHIGHEVRGMIQPPEKLGIHGKTVAVDFDICIADGICISACPVNVFEWFETPDCQTPNASGLAILAAKKPDPAKENDCILCRACEIRCPVMAIKITDPWQPIHPRPQFIPFSALQATLRLRGCSC
jgi:NAD-dependent dihydropyrimidine dehydrogenase PreA subunit